MFIKAHVCVPIAEQTVYRIESDAIARVNVQISNNNRKHGESRRQICDT